MGMRRVNESAVSRLPDTDLATERTGTAGSVSYAVRTAIGKIVPLLLVGLLVAACSIRLPVVGGEQSRPAGKPSPDFSLMDQEGKQVRLSDLRVGWLRSPFCTLTARTFAPSQPNFLARHTTDWERSQEGRLCGGECGP